MLLPISDRFSAGGQSTFAISNPSFLRRISDGEDHTGIRAAPAEIAADSVANLLGGGIGVLADKSRAGDDKAGRAEATLLGIVMHERLLHLVHPFRCPQSFDRGDFAAFGLYSQHRAGINRMAIHKDRAGTARATVANLFATGEIEPVAQRIQQGDTRFGVEFARLAVDPEAQGDLTRARDASLGGKGVLQTARGKQTGGHRTYADPFEEAASGEAGGIGRVNFVRHDRLSSRTAGARGRRAVAADSGSRGFSG